MPATGGKGRARAGACTLGLLVSGGFAVQLAGSSVSKQQAVARGVSFLLDASGLPAVSRQQQQARALLKENGRFLQNGDTPSPMTPSPMGLDDDGGVPTTDDLVDAVVTPTPMDIRGGPDTPNPAPTQESTTTLTPTVAQDAATPDPVAAEDAPTLSPTLVVRSGTPNPSTAIGTPTPRPTLTVRSDTPNPSTALGTPTSNPTLSQSGSSANPTEAQDAPTVTSSPAVAPAADTPSPVGDDEGTPAPVADDGTPSPATAAGETPSPVQEPTETAAPFEPSSCSNGIPGVQDGAVCCVEACGQCGGEGCGSIAGTNGASDCCPSTIIENAAGMFCGDAPCVIEGITPAPTAVPGTPSPFAPSTCSNGIPGVSDGNVCCKEECGLCGGEGCGAVAGTNGASDCCPDTIIEESGGAFCGDAPCVMEGFTPSPVNLAFEGTAAPVEPSTCSNGLAGYQDRDVCCVEACGQCGGAGCGRIPGTGGSENCCSSTIREAGVVCGQPPCVIEGYTPAPAVVGGGTAAPVVPSTCSNGLPGYQNGNACCVESCGQCGGDGCGTIPGTGGANSCCSSSVRATAEDCSVTLAAPCVIGDYTPSPINPALAGSAAPVVASTCSNGLAGVQNGAACCAEICGQCGGEGCGTIPGTGGSDNCCASSVLQANVICGNGVEAPCVIENYTPAPAGVPGQTAPFAMSTCGNGLAGVQNDNICCAENCGQCGGGGCGSIPGTGGSDSCCSSSIAANGTDCSVTMAAPCIMGDWIPTPAPAVLESAAPVVPMNCSNGIPGYQDESVCCKMACGQCGGEGCGRVTGTAGASDCCPSTILASNQTCSATVEAPCIIAATPAPTMSPAATTAGPSSSGNLEESANAAGSAWGGLGVLRVMTAISAVLVASFAFFGVREPRVAAVKQ